MRSFKNFIFSGVEINRSGSRFVEQVYLIEDIKYKLVN